VGGGQEAGYRAAHGDLAVTRWPAEGEERGRAVLLHCLFGDGGGWSLLGRQLAGDGYSVHAPDLPGHGDTLSEETSLEAMAGLVASFIRESLSGPVGLVGHSIGAIIAAEVAARWPDLVERLVLLAPAGIGPRINQDFIDGMLQARTTAALARALKELGDNTPVSVTLRRQMLAQLERRRSRLAMICEQIATGGIQQYDIIPLLAALECPVTTVFARNDRIIPWQQAVEIPGNVNVRFLASSGHMPQWSAPAFVASLLA
jgi:pyruvate dehydrogenase E2 component (dihydrolipoamide acetyltransferase)